MSAESILSRELDIRFIDARILVNEAKLSLDLCGYIDPSNQGIVLKKANELFRALDRSDQLKMKHASWELRNFKISSGSISTSEYQPSTSTDESSRSFGTSITMTHQQQRLSWPV